MKTGLLLPFFSGSYFRCLSQKRALQTSSTPKCRTSKVISFIVLSHLVMHLKQQRLSIITRMMVLPWYIPNHLSILWYIHELFLVRNVSMSNPQWWAPCHSQNPPKMQHVYDAICYWSISCKSFSSVGCRSGDNLVVVIQKLVASSQSSRVPLFTMARPDECRSARSWLGLCWKCHGYHIMGRSFGEDPIKQIVICYSSRN